MSMNIVHLYRKLYAKITAAKLDHFCPWIYDMREYCNYFGVIFMN